MCVLFGSFGCCLNEVGECKCGGELYVMVREL